MEWLDLAAAGDWTPDSRGRALFDRWRGEARFEGRLGFCDPVVVGITLIRGLTVRARSKAQRLRCRPDISFRRHGVVPHHFAR
jgi:hypothetical protein